MAAAVAMPIHLTLDAHPVVVGELAERRQPAQHLLDRRGHGGDTTVAGDLHGRPLVPVVDHATQVADPLEHLLVGLRTLTRAGRPGDDPTVGSREMQLHVAHVRRGPGRRPVPHRPAAGRPRRAHRAARSALRRCASSRGRDRRGRPPARRPAARGVPWRGDGSASSRRRQRLAIHAGRRWFR